MPTISIIAKYADHTDQMVFHGSMPRPGSTAIERAIAQHCSALPIGTTIVALNLATGARYEQTISETNA